MNDKVLTAVNGLECISKCKDVGEYIYHPINLRLFKVEKKPQCATTQFFDNKMGIGASYICDPKDPNNTENYGWLNYLVPPGQLSNDQLLTMVYGIKDFKGMLDWLAENEMAHIYTKARVIESFIEAEAHNNNPFKVLAGDKLFVETVKNILLEKYQNSIYKHIRGYFRVTHSGIKILKKCNYNIADTNEDKKSVLKYVKEQYLNNDTMSVLLLRFFEYNNGKTYNLEVKPLHKLVEYLTKYIINIAQGKYHK